MWIDVEPARALLGQLETELKRLQALPTDRPQLDAINDCLEDCASIRRALQDVPAPDGEHPNDRDHCELEDVQP